MDKITSFQGEEYGCVNGTCEELIGLPTLMIV